MKRTAAVLFAGTIASSLAAQDTLSIAREVENNIADVASFSATVETGEDAEGDPGAKSSSSLIVSREHGWKLTNQSGPEPYTFITDYNTFYQYFPNDKKVIKTTADTPEIKAMFTKPITDMNPLNLVDPKSLVLKGQENLNGETVYRIDGTTQSQLMPGGPMVKRTLTAWMSVEDGLPRKTIESVGVSTGTTVYKNVKVNPSVSAEDFQFTPPEGIAVIDTNEQMRRIEQQMKSGPGAKPAAGKP